MNAELMMGIAKQTLENLDITKVKRVDLQGHEYPDGTPVYTINILMRKDEVPAIDEAVTEPTEVPAVNEAVTEADGE